MKKESLSIGFHTFEGFTLKKPDSIGSTRIRANWLINNWEGAETYKMGKKYDVHIYQKVYWDEMMDNFDGIQIMDLCDPDWLEGRDVMKYCNMADAVVTSTYNLAKYIRKFVKDKPVVVIRDRIDFNLYPRYKTTHNEHIKTAIWYGYAQNAHYLRGVNDVLKARGIKLTIVSNEDPEIPDTTFYTYRFPDINELTAEHDIAIMPLVQIIDERGHYKSENKDTQVFALGVPVVKVPDDIDRLTLKSEREKEANERYEITKKYYDVKDSVKEYKELIKDIQDKTPVEAVQSKFDKRLEKGFHNYEKENSK